MILHPKMLINREMVYILKYMFALFVVNYDKIISTRTHIDLFCSVFKKIILDAITHCFQEVGGVAHPLIFHQRQIISSW